MKKVIRIIAVAICITLLGVTLCSCQYLDDKKDNHAIYCDDSKTSFTFRGYTYKKISSPSNMSFIEPKTDFTNAYVTEKDVPVLLSESYGNTMAFSAKEKNPVIIHIVSRGIGYVSPVSIRQSSYWAEYEDISGVFAREDHYDELTEKVKAAKLDSYYVTKYKDYSANAYFYESSYEDIIDPYEFELVSDEVAEAVNDSLLNGKKVKYTKLESDGWDSINIIPCDKDMILTNNNNVVFFKNKGDYYLLQTLNGNAFGEEVVKAPEKYTELFDKFYVANKELIYEGYLWEFFSSYEDYAES